MGEERINLIGLSRQQLAAEIAQMGEKPFRTRQLWHWIYERGAADFAAMTTLAKGLRQRLAERFTLVRPAVGRRQTSEDGASKWLLEFADGNEAETVYIPEEDRGALCVSSQVGCTLACSFCHTGTQRLVRNLSSNEIVGQMMLARDAYGEWPSSKEGRMISNVVLMGMGEPLYNYDAVAQAVRIFMDGEGLALSRRRITLSTAGVVPMIPRVGEELGVNLAVSLHAPDDATRDVLVPLNKKYPIAPAHRGMPRLPGRQQRPAHHLRVRDAEGHQRFAGRGAGPGAPGRRHSRQVQPHPLQSVARHRLHVLAAGRD